MHQAYNKLKLELGEELINILNYWRENTIDNENGGFFGRITYDNKVIEKASKGIILNTRILWSFSAASRHLKTLDYADIANRAYEYIRNFFLDKENGGVFWELNHKGSPINKRKQIYAQAFAVYAFSEYYAFSKNPEAKQLAFDLFELIEKHSRDKENGGYLEALAEDWSSLEDMRLSEKDMNAAKTMNTHLHLLEAYSSLLRIHDSPAVKEALEHLIRLFLEKFLNDNHHYNLFFSNDWQLMSTVISYGHDIEAAWLIIDAAECAGNSTLLEKAQTCAIQVADTFVNEAIDGQGAVMNEKNLYTGNVDTDRHWWPQVEALIGLSYAHLISPKPSYLNHSFKIWEFTKQHLIDREHGEWHFRVDEKGNVYTKEDKVSMWKAPYHTTRACILLNSKS